jgi:hypothetical protein
MTFEEIAERVDALEVIPREAALVSLRLIDLLDELDRAWFADARRSDQKAKTFSALFERLYFIKQGRHFIGNGYR